MVNEPSLRSACRLVINTLPTVIDCRPSPGSMRCWASNPESEKRMREIETEVAIDFGHGIALILVAN
jgi:hypothetical protein